MPIKTFTADDGLIQNDVYSAYQDSQGYIWWGTYEGLSRFDGIVFKNFTPKNSNLGGSIISSITEDINKNIWVAYNGGIAKLNKDKFLNYKTAESMAGSDIIGIWPDKKAGIWLVGTKGVSYFNGISFTNYLTEQFTPNLARIITGDKRGKIFVAAGTKIYYRQESQKKFSVLSDTGFKIQGIHYHKIENKLYLISKNAFYYLEGAKAIKISGSPLKSKLIDFLFEKEKIVWLASEKQIWKYSPEESVKYSEEVLNNASISRILKDREKNIWLARWGGISKIINTQILNYKRNVGDIITSIEYDSKGEIWISGERGISRLNKYREKYNLIKTDYINDFIIDRNRIIAATDSGIIFYNLDGKLLNTLRPDKGFNIILKDSSNKIWVGGNEGVYILENKKLRPQENATDGLETNKVWVLFEDKEKSIWVGTENGLSRLKSGKWNYFTTSSGLSSNTIWSIIESPVWGVLIGTENGVNLKKGEGFVPVEFTSDKSLSDARNTLSGLSIDYMAIDKTNRLWVGGKYGLFIINSKYELELHLNKDSGLSTNSIYTSGSLKTKEHILAGSYKGLAQINQNIQAKTKVKPRVMINRITVMDKTEELSYLKKPIPYQNNSLSFYFRAIHTTSPEKIKYHYYLEGLENNWKKEDSINRATYTSLSPGNYTFHLQVITADNIPSDDYQISFTIEKPFWQEWWFLLFISLILIYFIYFMINLSHQRKISKVKIEKANIANQNKRLEREVEDRTYQIKKLLDSTGQGFLSFGSNYLINKEYSKACDLFFIDKVVNGSIAGVNAIDLIFSSDLDQIKEMFDLVFSGVTTLSAAADLLPKEIEVSDKILSIDYRLLEEKKKENRKVLIILTDISLSKMLERKLKKDEEKRQMIIKIATDRDGFLKFLRELNHLLHNIEFNLKQPIKEVDHNQIFRDLHTIKGTAACYKMGKVANKAHDIENKLEKYKAENISLEDSILKIRHEVDDLKDTLDNILDSLNQLLPRELISAKAKNFYKISEQKLDYLEGLVNNYHSSNSDLKKALKSLRKQPLRNLLNNYSSTALDLAEKLGKKLEVRITGERTEIIHKPYELLFISLIHMVRNSVDHGIELPLERLEKGKAEAGIMEIDIDISESNLIIQITDDGRGINCDSLKKTALRKNIITEEKLEKLTEPEIMRLVFAPGFSTKSAVSDFSGRGFGLDAVGSVVEELNGTIEINSTLDKGTSFRISVPEQL